MVLDEIFQKRKLTDKKSAINKGYKLALNGVYGKSNSPYSDVFDSQYTMATTVNGQLMLCMLAEWVLERIEYAKLLQANTDGLTFKIRRDFIPRLNEILEEWKTLTQLELEQVEYKKMVIRDVNNYLAISIKEGEDNKRKGCFAWKVKPGELELHRNHSQLIVPKALELYYSNNIPIEQTILNHRDIFDFFGRVKIDSRFKLDGRKLEQHFILYPYKKKTKGKTHKEIPINCILEEQHLQKITRYYISTDGFTIVKTKLDSMHESIINVGYLATECNDLRGVDLNTLFNNLNYDYYIEECNRIIHSIENNLVLEQIEEDES